MWSHGVFSSKKWCFSSREVVVQLCHCVRLELIICAVLLSVRMWSHDVFSSKVRCISCHEEAVHGHKLMGRPVIICSFMICSNVKSWCVLVGSMIYMMSCDNISYSIKSDFVLWLMQHTRMWCDISYDVTRYHVKWCLISIFFFSSLEAGCIEIIREEKVHVHTWVRACYILCFFMICSNAKSWCVLVERGVIMCACDVIIQGDMVLVSSCVVPCHFKCIVISGIIVVL
jgi:hypothetical protein